MKRACDIVVAFVILIVGLPLWILISVIILIFDGVPVFYRGERVGLNGQSFLIVKFRTMRKDPKEGLSRITGSHNPRITRLGRALRRSKLDEIPQLANVLWGDMSIVGPRPEDPRYVQLYTEEQMKVLSVRPGVVGPATAWIAHEEDYLGSGQLAEEKYVSILLPRKLELDLSYVNERGLLLDVKIVFGALWRLLRGLSLSRPQDPRVSE